MLGAKTGLTPQVFDSVIRGGRLRDRLATAKPGAQPRLSNLN